MARSVWKGPFVDLHLLKKAETAQDAGQASGAGRGAPIKTWSRRSTILPQFVGLSFSVAPTVRRLMTEPGRLDALMNEELDEPGVLVLARRLLREGALVVVDG